MSQLDRINQSFKSARIKINAFLRRQRWKDLFLFRTIVFRLLAITELAARIWNRDQHSGQIQEHSTGYFFYGNTTSRGRCKSKRQRKCFAELFLRAFVCPYRSKYEKSGGEKRFFINRQKDYTKRHPKAVVGYHYFNGVRTSTYRSGLQQTH